MAGQNLACVVIWTLPKLSVQASIDLHHLGLGIATVEAAGGGPSQIVIRNSVAVDAKHHEFRVSL